MSDLQFIEDLVKRLGQQEQGATFLSPEDIATLTGRKTKSRQIEALRNMGIPFFINGIGHPVVARSAIEGGKAVIEQPKREWVPPGLRKK